MTWFKVDDSFHSHSKVMAASPAALGLWVIAGSWSASKPSDGFVPDHVLPRLLPDSAELARELVTVGLWRREKGGYRFHDWLEYQPSAEHVAAERDAAKERMRKLRADRKPRSPERSGEQPANVRALFATPSRTSFRSSKGAGTQAPRDPCPTHAGQSAANCGPCRSERLGAS